MDDAYRRTRDTAPAIDVAECTPDLLRALESAMPSQHHRARYGVQTAGHGVYFVARLGERPAGHGLLRWQPTDQIIRQSSAAEPCIEALGVDPPMQSRGLGTALIVACEGAVLGRGCSTIGLAVGIDNQRARSLYERLGYRDIGVAPFEITWSYVDAEGAVRTGREVCIYMRKRLSAV